MREPEPKSNQKEQKEKKKELSVPTAGSKCGGLPNNLVTTGPFSSAIERINGGVRGTARCSTFRFPGPAKESNRQLLALFSFSVLGLFSFFQLQSECF